MSWKTIEESTKEGMTLIPTESLESLLENVPEECNRAGLYAVRSPMKYPSLWEGVSDLLKNFWERMDSAPTDGSRVILWNEHWTGPCSGQFYGYIGWGVSEESGIFRYQPTHWMPLPDPPK